MPQSFRKRFAGREQEVVNEIKCFGSFAFCEREGIAGFGLQRWFREQEGCKNDSIYRYVSSDLPKDDLPFAKQLILAFQRIESKYQASLAVYQTRLDEKNRRIEFLEEQLRYFKMGEFKDLQPVLEFVNNMERATDKMPITQEVFRG